MVRSAGDAACEAAKPARLPGENATDFRDQRVGRAGLRDEPVATRAGRTLQLSGTVMSGQRDNRDV
jgi:hypothetical protein